jgi:hypothetical protein
MKQILIGVPSRQVQDIVSESCNSEVQYRQRTLSSWEKNVDRPCDDRISAVD